MPGASPQGLSTSSGAGWGWFPGRLGRSRVRRLRRCPWRRPGSGRCSGMPRPGRRRRRGRGPGPRRRTRGPSRRCRSPGTGPGRAERGAGRARVGRGPRRRGVVRVRPCHGRLESFREEVVDAVRRAAQQAGPVVVPQRLDGQPAAPGHRPDGQQFLPHAGTVEPSPGAALPYCSPGVTLCGQEMLRRLQPGHPGHVLLQSVARLTARAGRLSRDYIDLSINALTCYVRSLKGISEVHVILPPNLKKPLHDAIIKNLPISAEPQVIR